MELLNALGNNPNRKLNNVVENSNRNKRKAELNITYTMISIVTVFLICHTCHTIPFVLSKIIGETYQLNCIMAILVNFSASINTLIYCIFNKKFREILFKWLTHRCFHNNQRHDITDPTVNPKNKH